MQRLRPARPDEAAALSELARRSKAHWGYTADEMAVFQPELTLTPEGMAGARTHVLEQEARLLGFYSLVRRADAALELEHLFVDPDRLGQGIGRSLFEHACARARREGFGRLVIQSDPHAAGFYEALGSSRMQDIPSSIAGRSIPLFHHGLGDEAPPTAPPAAVALYEGLPDGEPGVAAWCLDSLGLATWAPTRAQVLERLPGKQHEFARWLRRHGEAPPEPAGFEVVEETRGGEILFAWDRQPATPEEIDATIQRLAWSRADLLATVESLPDAALDWDPPYRDFAPWADWRSIRANLLHVANGENRYYTQVLGWQSPLPLPDASAPWREVLAESRAECIAFLQRVRDGEDLARVRSVELDLGYGSEDWSVRKVLRRLVRHELTHWKSICRIAAEWERRGTVSA